MANPKTREEVIAISNAVADQWGIPRALLLACGIAEGNLRWNARRPANASQDAAYWPDVSAGVWQQTVRYDPEYQGGNEYPGPAETERILQRQYDVERSAHVAAENLKRKFRGDPNNDADILSTLARYNWPNGQGKFWTVEHEQNYRRGLTEARTILGVPPVPPMTVPFNADAPITPQPDPWSCAVRSAQWLLRAVGRNPGDAWITTHLLDEGIVTREHGLMDASGKQLADWLNHEYGVEGGWTAQAAPVTFDDVLAGAGTNPTLIGGRRWGEGGHWAGVRRADEAGWLELANSAAGYTGVGTHLDRDEWDSRGPWSAIWIDRASVVAPPALPPPAPPIVLPPAEDTRVTRVRELIRQALAILDEPSPV